MDDIKDPEDWELEMIQEEFIEEEEVSIEDILNIEYDIANKIEEDYEGASMEFADNVTIIKGWRIA